MADQIRFFTESYTYKPDATADNNGVGNDTVGHPPEDALDYDKVSYWENDAAAPQFDIDLGAAYTIDSFFIWHFNIDLYTLYYSTDDITYNGVADGTDEDYPGLKYKMQFTPREARYWRIIVTAKAGAGDIKFYEVMLAHHLLVLGAGGADVELPAMMDVILDDKAGGGYDLANGAFTTYSGERVFVNIDIHFTYLPKTQRDDLLVLYRDADAGYRAPMLIYPDETEYPDDVYRVLWADTKFPMKYQTSYKLSGWKGTLSFQEY